MALRQFRRHLSICLNGVPGDPKRPGLKSKKLTKEQLRAYQYCKCPVYFCGTWNGKTYPRTALNVNDWHTAEQILAAKVKEVDAGLAADAGRHLLVDALNKWYKASTLPPAREPDTIEKHKMLGASLLAHMKLHKIEPYLNLVDGSVIDDWRSTWTRRGTDQPLADTTHGTRLALIARFFNFCRKAGMIKHNPVHQVDRPPRKPATKEDTKPVDVDGTETNYHAILAALPHLRLRQRNRGVRFPVSHRLVITELMYEAGLRVSDAIFFDLRLLTMTGDVASYTFLPFKTRKKQKEFTTFLPLGLVEKIRALQPLGPDANIPFFDSSKVTKTLKKTLHQYEAHLWHVYQRVGESIGVDDLHPHRFRNSFAVNNLNRGVRIETVSQMLAHSDLKTTKDYYSPWVQSRLDAARQEYIAGRERAAAQVAQ